MKRITLFILLVFFTTGCNISLKDDSSTKSISEEKLKAYYVDEPVSNVDYKCGIYSGKTNSKGLFYFQRGKECSLFLGTIKLRDIDTSNLKDGTTIFESDSKIAALIQSLDKNRMYTNVIEIDKEALNAIKKIGILEVPKTDKEREELISKINKILKNGSFWAVSEENAILNLKHSIYNYEEGSILLTNPNANWLTKDIITLYVKGSSSINNTLSSNINWYKTTKIYTSNIHHPKEIEKRNYTLLAWSELGMHCMDGEYKVFALLPPYNTLKAQLIVNGTSPRIVSSGVKLTYEAVRKENGNINTSSKNKTDFWLYADKLFPSIKSLKTDIGLKGKPTQSLTPTPMDFNISLNMFVAEGIPTTPISDDGTQDEYPAVKVVAKDEDGNILASTITTLPVSDELDCMKCHSSRVDILKKHDDNFPNAVKDYDSKLQAKGFKYNTSGLVATYKNNKTPILCASCHKSNAIKNSGIDGIKPLTEAIHTAHSFRNDPFTGEPLNNNSTRDSCYYCHPGEDTKCLRGAMGSSEIECQNCHGNMEVIGKSQREGWKDEPNCQACHQNGKRFTNAIVDEYKGTLRDAIDKRFATEQTLIDPHGPRLYKDSAGHGGIACAGCHGAQHAIYPSTIEEENLQNINLQGYKGTLRECGVCHKENPPLSVLNGPHGLHTIGQRWVDMHGTIVLRDGLDNCKKCHGQNLEGSNLSKVGTRREFKLGVINKSVIFEANEKVSCKKCHNMEVSQ